uniref:Glycerate kinase n=1 Tax=Candidatus Kentrum sp. LPFa TaxID=2126335 RepID=A0A450W5N0_9GAMM|nr:MAG: glycerate kinase [Candidatus Kentron sp. LPFa]
MRILISPDSYRGVLSVRAVADAIEEGLKRSRLSVSVVKQPVADGGEGTVDVLVKHLQGRFVTSSVTGLLGDPIEAKWGLLFDDTTAVIEISAASGVETVPASRRDPMLATTYGTGELIRNALDCGCRQILLGLGGSGTIDGGLGILEALGVRFHDADGQLLPRGGGALSKLETIDANGVDPRICNGALTVLCDIDTPIFFDGASIARMFGPQKGCDADEVTQLELGFERLISAIKDHCGSMIGRGLYDGASGGVAGSLRALVGAKLDSGIDTILSLLRFDELLRTADVVITGEGKIDRQTLRGKAPLGVIRAAKRFDTPVYCLTGILTDGVSPDDLGCSAPIFELPDNHAGTFDPETGYSQIVQTAEKLGDMLHNANLRAS